MYLQKIQKVFKVFAILSKVAMILSFVSGGLAIFFGIMSLAGSDEVVLKLGEVRFVLASAYDGLPMGNCATLFAEGAAALFSGTILVFVMRYFNLEQKEGNPFTTNGADALKKLGIITIVLSAVSVCVQSIIFTVFKLNPDMDISNGAEVCAGILMIIFSMIVRYGAQLRSEKTEIK